MHNCYYVSLPPNAQACHEPARWAILGTTEDQGERLQAYACDAHKEETLAYWARLGYTRVRAVPADRRD